MPWPHSPALTAEEVPSILIRHPVAVIHCWAAWNGYDLQLDRVLSEIRPRYADRITFFALDFDLAANQESLKIYNIASIPALVCFLNGAWHETSIGNLNEQDLARKLDAWRVAANLP